MDYQFRHGYTLKTRALFIEFVLPQYVKEAIYTVKDKDFDGYISLKKRYLEMEDTTEYLFAVEYFENYAHWERICQTEWFAPHINQWRKELELKIKAKAIKNIMDVAQGSSKDAMQANKFLATKGYVEKNEKGRPSKEQVKNEVDRLADLESRMNDDLARIEQVN